MKAAQGRRLYEEQQVWAAHRAMQQSTQRRLDPEALLAADEAALIQRARGSRAPAPVAASRVVRTASAPKQAPYPSADARTLQLLGTIDALLKAPPRPPRWALLRILSLLEEFRASPTAVQSESTDLAPYHSSDEAEARATGRRVLEALRQGGGQEPRPHDVRIPSDHRRVRETRDARGAVGMRIS